MILSIIVGGAIVLAIWQVVVATRRRWIARDAEYIQGWIKPPRSIFEGADESLPAQADRRRQQAATKKLEAARITSAGESHDSKRIRIVR